VPRSKAKTRTTSPTLAQVLAVMQEIAPPELAAEWDNTGLLLEPHVRRRSVERVLLTIDLTVPVVAEARRARADLVIAYHPPIFRGWKRLLASDPAQCAVVEALRADFAVYSPHTALDGAVGGIADWLATGVASDREIRSKRPCGEGGFGRVVELARSVSLATLLPRIRRHLGVSSLRLALPSSGRRLRVRTVAVAAGAGSSVLENERADVWLTGEMPHHDALAAVAAGTAVVLGEHSNTERGYLTLLRKRLRAPFGSALNVRIARTDRDPFVHT